MGGELEEKLGGACHGDTGNGAREGHVGGEVHGEGCASVPTV